MPENWVTKGLSLEDQFKHAQRANEQLRQAYRKADTARVEAIKALYGLRGALEELISEARGPENKGSLIYMDDLQEVLDEHAR